MLLISLISFLLISCVYNPGLPNDQLNEVAKSLAEGNENGASERILEIQKKYSSHHRPYAFRASYMMTQKKFDSASIYFNKANKIYQDRVVGAFDPFGTLRIADFANGVVANWEGVYIEWIENELFRKRCDLALKIIHENKHLYLSDANKVRVKLLEIRAAKRVNRNSSDLKIMYDTLNGYLSEISYNTTLEGVKYLIYLDAYEVTRIEKYLDISKSSRPEKTTRLDSLYFETRVSAIQKSPNFDKILSELISESKGNVCLRLIYIGMKNLYRNDDYYEI